MEPLASHNEIKSILGIKRIGNDFNDVCGDCGEPVEDNKCVSCGAVFGKQDIIIFQRGKLPRRETILSKI
jgi:hypothetical protein